MAHDRPHHLHGMAMGAAGYGIFTLYDTLLKQTSHAYPQWQIMATTSATSAVLVMAFALMTGGIKRLKTSRPALHFARATFSVISFGCAFYAIRHIPLTDFYGIIFAAPIISTALSILWLREHVNWQRWLAVIGGFAGIIVMLKTGIAQAPTDTARLGYFASMAAAVLNSAVMIMVRRYGQGETNVAFSFYSALYCFLLTSALLLAWGGVAYATADLALVILAGALGGGASVLMMSAFLRAPAAAVAPFQYTQMIWGTILGYLVFHDIPQTNMLMGAMIVIASGIAMLWREARIAYAMKRAGALAGKTP